MIPSAAIAADGAVRIAPEIGGISNYERISAELLRGAQPTDDGIRALADQGVRTIIDLRKPSDSRKHEESLAQSLGLKYVNLPMGFGTPANETISKFLEIAGNPDYQPVFVHCRQGADRTGTLVGIYRTHVQGWSFKKAYAEMRQFHFKPWLVAMRRTVERFANKQSANVPSVVAQGAPQTTAQPMPAPGQ